MPDQLFERLVSHHHGMGTAAVDEPHDVALLFEQQEALWILADTGADLFQGCRLVALVGTHLNLVAALGVGHDGLAKLQVAHGQAPGNKMASRPF